MCESCGGTGRIEIEENDGYTSVPCHCMPALRDCAKGHIRITFRASKCPLCKLIKERGSHEQTKPNP